MTTRSSFSNAAPFNASVQTPMSARPFGMPPAARFVVKMMERMSIGSLTAQYPDGSSARFGHGQPHAEIVLANWKVCEAAFKSGDIGFGETWIAGDWTTPDLLALMNVMVANRTAIEAVIHGKWWGRLLHRVKHLLNRNTRTGSKKNIHAHYDIGNAFYKLWLDPTMTYSSALFADDVPASAANVRDDFARMPEAHDAKYRRVLDRLALAPGQRVLEIGCGWGGFAEAAARDGFEVTGLTLSAEQFAYARERIAAAKLEDRVELRIQDYRDANGQYDGIASIEMFEAVGENFWPDYFDCIKRNLKPGGRVVVQTITIADALFADYRKSSDFIQQYIFPGGMLPSVAVFREQVRRAGLVIVDQLAFGQHYARTLAAWLTRFLASERAVRAAGFDTAFIRTWAFYLAYCAAAFRHENTDVVQFTLERTR